MYLKQNNKHIRSNRLEIKLLDKMIQNMRYDKDTRTN